ncbi:MAG: FMN-binding protein [Firmicutes bacterium]|nr:FMN-binding protein [Bacillota bacterium]
MMIVAVIAGCGGDSIYEDGTYFASAKGYNGDVEVEVEIENDKIVAVNIGEHSETPGIADAAFTKVTEAIIDTQSTDVDIESGATLTSEAVINAVNSALSKAEK